MTIKSKIVSLPKLKQALTALRKKGKTIAFTNGCFDIIHLGHVTYLEKAKKKDRVLVVGLNADQSVRRLKGPSRPINREGARAGVMAALESVDFVTIFREDTPYNLIKAIAPDILIKGADWKGKPVAGSDLVKKVEFIKFVDNFSTTKIVQAIAKQKS